MGTKMVQSAKSSLRHGDKMVQNELYHSDVDTTARIRRSISTIAINLFEMDAMSPQMNADNAVGS